ncbi:hypothetical protein [Pararhizobium sp. DWP1-1-3]|uniref:hypothetical protein n=1 Tax=Pararhizobium sp. DWP1-1-3 TaxID=2804652 RepID=UPI003CE9592A
MRISILAIWLLPAFCEDITNAVTSGPWLTDAGRTIIWAVVYFSILGAWLWAVAHFVSDEASKAKAATLQGSIFATLEGKEYLMVPADLEQQAELRRENRRSKQITRMLHTVE